MYFVVPLAELQDVASGRQFETPSLQVQVLFTPVKPVECPTQWSAGCEPTENLRLVKIPSGATRIADFALSRCEALVKVEIPNTVTVKLHPTP